VLYAYPRCPSSLAWRACWRRSASPCSSSPSSASERREEQSNLNLRQCIKTIMNTKTPVMNQDWVLSSMSNSLRRLPCPGAEIEWTMCGISLTAITPARLMAVTWQQPGNNTVVNPVLIAYKGSNAHILYRNESKQRAFSEPKFYPDFWVITMGIGKAHRWEKLWFPKLGVQNHFQIIEHWDICRNIFVIYTKQMSHFFHVWRVTESKY